MVSIAHPSQAAAPSAPGSLAVWKFLLPVAVAAALALMPPPPGLAPHAWNFFAIFAGVIVGLMLEPLPGAAIGLIGVVLVTVLAPWVLFGPAELAKAGFNGSRAAGKLRNLLRSICLWSELRSSFAAAASCIGAGKTASESG